MSVSIRRDLARIRKAAAAHTAEPVGALPDPVDWAQGAAGILLDPWQAELLRDQTSKRMLLCCARQTGKSEVTSLMGAFAAACRPGFRVAVISPSQRQSSILYQRIERTLERAGCTFSQRTRTFLQVEGGGSVVSLPGDRPDLCRGLTVDLAAVDESAFVKPGIFAALPPSLATTNGRLVLLSTPSGAVGQFYELWSQGGDEWRRVQVTAEQSPRITPAFLASERRRLGDLLFSQEYECAFIQAADALFSASDLDRMFSPVTDAPAPWLKPAAPEAAPFLQ